MMIRKPKTPLAALVLAASLGAQALAQAQSPAPSPTPGVQRVRGTIERAEADRLVVRAREGESVTIALAPDAAVSAVVKADLGSIGPGAYVGTAAMPQPDGDLRALEVLVFPEAMRGAGEGHGPWDLLPESTMTNATVADTVAGVDAGAGGRALTLRYKGETKRVVVPGDVPVVTFAPASRDELKAGAAVFVPATRGPDGGLRAARVVVGRDGVAPPM